MIIIHVWKIKLIRKLKKSKGGTKLIIPTTKEWSGIHEITTTLTMVFSVTYYLELCNAISLYNTSPKLEQFNEIVRIIG